MKKEIWVTNEHGSYFGYTKEPEEYSFGTRKVFTARKGSAILMFTRLFIKQLGLIIAPNTCKKMTIEISE